jgi:hypothetical protein
MKNALNWMAAASARPCVLARMISADTVNIVALLFVSLCVA